jgi:hypothetical protein
MACYRFAKQLRSRDEWALATCVERVIAGLRDAFPEMGRDVAIDGSDLPAYANGHRKDHNGVEREQSDPDASWGHRSAISTRKGGGYYGYKVRAAVDVATGLPTSCRLDDPREAQLCTRARSRVAARRLNG